MLPQTRGVSLLDPGGRRVGCRGGFSLSRATSLAVVGSARGTPPLGAAIEHYWVRRAIALEWLIWVSSVQCFGTCWFVCDQPSGPSPPERARPFSGVPRTTQPRRLGSKPARLPKRLKRRRGQSGGQVHQTTTQPAPSPGLRKRPDSGVVVSWLPRVLSTYTRCQGRLATQELEPTLAVSTLICVPATSTSNPLSRSPSPATGSSNHRMRHVGC